MSTDPHTVARIQELERELAEARAARERAEAQRDRQFADFRARAADYHSSIGKLASQRDGDFRKLRSLTAERDAALARLAEVEAQRIDDNAEIDALRKEVAAERDAREEVEAKAEATRAAGDMLLDELEDAAGYAPSWAVEKWGPNWQAARRAWREVAPAPTNLHGPKEACPPIATGHYWETLPDGTRTLRALRLVGGDEGTPEGSG